MQALANSADENMCDAEAAKQLLQNETQKLNLLESRIEIYKTLYNDCSQATCNEMRLAADHTSRNEKATRAIVTFRQARKLLGSISLDRLIKDNKVIADMSAYVRWDYHGQNYLELDCFRSGTMQIQKFPVHTKLLHIRYLEASWPANSTFHRL